jgi:hypothetical protein
MARLTEFHRQHRPSRGACNAAARRPPLLEEEEDALLSGRRPLATLLSPVEGGRSLRDRPAMDPNLHHRCYYYSALQLEPLLRCRQSQPRRRSPPLLLRAACRSRGGASSCAACRALLFCRRRGPHSTNAVSRRSREHTSSAGGWREVESRVVAVTTVHGDPLAVVAEKGADWILLDLAVVAPPSLLRR